jgi:hypothetical protein
VVLFGTASAEHLLANIQPLSLPYLPATDRERVLELFGSVSRLGLESPRRAQVRRRRLEAAIDPVARHVKVHQHASTGGANSAVDLDELLAGLHSHSASSRSIRLSSRKGIFAMYVTNALLALAASLLDNDPVARRTLRTTSFSAVRTGQSRQ